MYKTRNTGTGNGIRGTRGMGNVVFRAMSPNISGNVVKHSGECRQTFWGMSPNIPGNIAKYSRECRQIFRGMSPNIPGNVAKYSGEFSQTFREMLPNIPGNITKHSGEYHQTFRGISKIPRNAHNRLAFKFSGRAPKYWTQFY